MRVHRHTGPSFLSTWPQLARQVVRRRWVQQAMAIGGAALAIASLYVVASRLIPWLRDHHWRSILHDGRPVLGAVVAFCVCPLLRGLVWWNLLAAFGHDTALLDSLSAQARANLVKYLPGGFWELAGKAYLSARSGSPAPIAGFCAIVDLGSTLGTGVVVALGLMPTDSMLFGMPSWARGPALLVLVAGFSALPWMLGAVTGRATAYSRGAVLASPARLYLANLVMVIHWVVAGAGLAILVTALGPVGQGIDLWFATYSLAVAATIGLVVVVAPAGIGVREAMLTQLLGQRIALGAASFVALLSRLGLVLGELVAWVVVEVVVRVVDRRVRAEHDAPHTTHGSSRLVE